MYSSIAVMTMVLVLQSEPDQQTSPNLEVAVRRLVRQLDHDNGAQRELAERALMDLGPGILVLLPDHNQRNSGEVGQRLQRVRKHLEKISVAVATHATQVTLSGEMSLLEALAGIEKQTGNRIVDYRKRFGQQVREIRVEIDFQRVSFWHALDRVLDQAGMTLYNYAGVPGAIAVVSRDVGQSYNTQRVVYNEIFRLEATRVEAVRNLRNPDHHSLRLGLEVIWEPRIVPIGFHQRLDKLKAVDPQGNPLTVDSRQGQIEVPIQKNVSALEMEIPLQLPDRSVRKIDSLRGNFVAMVPGPVEPFSFVNLSSARDVEKRKARVTVVLIGVRKNTDLHEVQILVRFEKTDGALDSHYSWIYDNGAFLIDGDGKKKNHDGLAASRRGPDEFGFSYKFVLDRKLDEYSFVYETPVDIVQLPVDYVFSDIELP